MATWTNVSKSSNEVSEIDFLFTDASDFLFTNSTDFVFREAASGLVWTNTSKASAPTWTNISKS